MDRVTEIIYTRVTKEERKQLEAVIKDTQRSLSSQIREYIRDGLKEHERENGDDSR